MTKDDQLMAAQMKLDRTRTWPGELEGWRRREEESNESRGKKLRTHCEGLCLVGEIEELRGKMEARRMRCGG